MHKGPRPEEIRRPRSAVTRFIRRDGWLAAAVVCYVTASVLSAIGIAHFRSDHSTATDLLIAGDVLRTAAFLLVVVWGFMRTRAEQSWGRAVRALSQATEPPPDDPGTEPQWQRRAG